MLSEQDQRQLDSEKRAFRDWWAGDRARPFVLQRRENYGVCRILFPNWWADVAFNLRFALMYLIGKLPWSALKVWLYRRMGVRIGRGVYIAPGVFIDAFYPQLIELDDGSFLGIGCRILAHEYTATFFRAGQVRVGKGSVVGAWSIIRCGVTLGQAVTTGLGSVVVRDVGDGLTVGGVPARPLVAGEDLASFSSP
jgi:acetyltransferase-like isoleucine patch superfamily enzyme